MPIQQWSEGILLADLADEPQFSEEMQAVIDRLGGYPPPNVVLNFGQVSHINSTNISQLLRVRQRLVDADRHLRLCSVPDSVWGVLLTTGLDKVFELSPDVSAALASLQLDE